MYYSFNSFTSRFALSLGVVFTLFAATKVNDQYNVGTDAHFWSPHCQFQTPTILYEDLVCYFAKICFEKIGIRIVERRWKHQKVLNWVHLHHILALCHYQPKWIIRELEATITFSIKMKKEAKMFFCNLYFIQTSTPTLKISQNPNKIVNVFYFLSFIFHDILVCSKSYLIPSWIFDSSKKKEITRAMQ